MKGGNVKGRRKQGRIRVVHRRRRRPSAKWKTAGARRRFAAEEAEEVEAGDYDDAEPWVCGQCDNEGETMACSDDLCRGSGCLQEQQGRPRFAFCYTVCSLCRGRSVHW